MDSIVSLNLSTPPVDRLSLATGSFICFLASSISLVVSALKSAAISLSSFVLSSAVLQRLISKSSVINFAIFANELKFPSLYFSRPSSAFCLGSMIGVGIVYLVKNPITSNSEVLRNCKSAYIDSKFIK